MMAWGSIRISGIIMRRSAIQTAIQRQALGVGKVESHGDGAIQRDACGKHLKRNTGADELHNIGV